MLEVRNVSKFFPAKSNFWGKVISQVHAVDDVSFHMKRGETLGLVGESGCGKSTLARTILRFYEPSSGRVFFQGRDLSRVSSKEMRTIRKDIQMVFQDPVSSLNPRMTIRKILSEPFLIHRVLNKASIQSKTEELLEKVGLKKDVLDLYPHEFSGGQRQRICIARALALNPQLLICDEPVSALDVSIRSQILNLLVDLREELGLTYLFISHDLAVVEHLCNRIAVMYLGKIVELGNNHDIFHKTAHPYTKALIKSVPGKDFGKKGTLIQNSKTLKGDIPSPFAPPSGCHFHPRCPLATERCKTEKPELRQIGSDQQAHWVSCHYAE